MKNLLRWTLIVAFVVASVSPAHAFGWGWFGSTSSYQTSYYYYPAYYTTSYYYPASFTTVFYTPTVTYYAPAAPVFVAPVVECAPTVVVPVQPQAPTYAQPTPAPPSQSPEPPAIMPRVQEGRALYQAYYSPGAAANSSQVQAGFWNVTKRNIALNVNGQSLIVPAGQMVNVNVPRQFSWQYDNGVARSESVAANQGTIEIIIRN